MMRFFNSQQLKPTEIKKEDDSRTPIVENSPVKMEQAEVKYETARVLTEKKQKKITKKTADKEYLPNRV